MMIRALNRYDDLCLYKSHVNRNDTLWLSLPSKRNTTNCHDRQLLRGPAMKFSCIKGGIS